MRLEDKLANAGRIVGQVADGAMATAGGLLTRAKTSLVGKLELAKLTTDDMIRKVEAWQSHSVVDQLTCGNDSTHDLLKAIKVADANNRVVLVCPTCLYVRETIPEQVLLADPATLMSTDS